MAIAVEDRTFRISEAVHALGPTNESQVKMWLARGVLQQAGEPGAPRIALVELIRGLILLDLQRTLGPTNGLAADVARALTPEAISRLFHTESPEIHVETDNGKVVFMPDPEVVAEFRERLRLMLR
jgi:hypothetical protein